MLTLVSAVLAAVFVILSVICMLLETALLAIVFMIFAAGAVILALAGIIISKNET